MSNIGDEQPSMIPYSKILVARLDWIGDMVLLSPFLRELRRSAPNANITLVANKRNENLLQTCPHIDDLVCLDVGNSKVSVYNDILRVASLAIKLAGGNYDLALAPNSNGARLGSLAKLLILGSRARTTIAYAEKKSEIGKLLDRLLTNCLPIEIGQHEVISNIDLLSKSGVCTDNTDLEVWLSDEDEQFADSVFEQNFRGSEPVIAIAPGSGTSLKEWEATRFASVASALSEDAKVRFLVLGDSADEEKGKVISLHSGALNLAGRTTLRQAAAMLKRCSLLVCNDSSLMHLAAAVRTPVIALFGASCADRFSPWGKGHCVLRAEVDCSPCRRLDHSPTCHTCIFDSPICMRQISVSLVKDAILKKLADSRTKPLADTEFVNVSSCERIICS